MRSRFISATFYFILQQNKKSKNCKNVNFTHRVVFASAHFVPVTGCFCEEAEAAIICASRPSVTFPLVLSSSPPLFPSVAPLFLRVSALLQRCRATDDSQRAPRPVFTGLHFALCVFIYKRVCVAASSASLASRGSIRERMRGGRGYLCVSAPAFYPLQRLLELRSAPRGPRPAPLTHTHTPPRALRCHQKACEDLSARCDKIVKRRRGEREI